MTRGSTSIDGVFATTTDLINYAGNWRTNQKIETTGFAVSGDGGGAVWKLTGNIIAPSQTPALTETSTLSDANGNEFSLMFDKFINPKKLGALSLINSSLEVQAALNASDYINGEGGTFKINSGLISATLEEIRDLDLDFSDGIANTSALKCAGNKTDETLLVSNAVKGSKIIEATDATNYLSRDLLLIVSDAIIDSNNTNSTIGELGYIESVVGNTITMDAPLLDTYNTTDNAKIFKITTVNDLTVYNVGITGSDAADNDLTGIEIVFGDNVNIINSTIKNTSTRSIVYDNCIKSSITLTEFDNLFDDSTGYAISALGPTRNCRFSLNKMRDCRHSLSTNNSSLSAGITRFITFSQNEVLNSSKATGGSGGDAIDTHAGAEEIYIEDNVVIGSSNMGVNFECVSGRISRNKIYDTESNGIQAHNETDRNGSITIEDNEVYRTGAAGIRVTQGVRGTTAIYEDTVITGNKVYDTATQGIYHDNTNSQQIDYTIADNVVVNAGTEGIRVDKANDGQIISNRIKNPSSHGIRIQDGDNALVASNRIKSDASVSLIYMEGTGAGLSDGHLITSNLCTGLSGSVAEWGVQLNDNVTDSAVYTNQLKLTNGVNLGAGLGNVESTNKT